MIRVLNFFCVALMGLSILALYHISEKTRVARMELTQVTRQIAQEHATIGVLQTEWERVAGPARIQALAETRLGMSDTSSVQLSSFDQLPRQGEAPAPLGDSRIHNASVQLPSPAPLRTPPLQQISDRSGM